MTIWLDFGSIRDSANFSKLTRSKPSYFSEEHSSAQSNFRSKMIHLITLDIITM